MAYPVDAIRNKLYDTAAENTFLQQEEFHDQDITRSAASALSYWNSSRPLIESLNYPEWADVPSHFSEYFIQGTIGILLLDKVNSLSRNRQPVAVEGIGVDPESRMDAYTQLGQQYLSQFLQWAGMAKHTKAVNGVITASPTYETSFFQFYRDTYFETDFEVTDRDGIAMDLTPYDIDLRLVPAAGTGSQNTLLDKELTHDNAKAHLELEPSDLSWSGVAAGELVLSEDGKPKHRFRLYGCAEPNLFDGEVLTVAKLRDFLRDRVGENYLLEDIEFSNATLSKAVIDAVKYWNSAPPRIRRYMYTPLTFPSDFLLQWEEAAAAYALKTAANKLVRNSLLPVEGASHEVQQRAQTYLELSRALEQQWQQWVNNIKYTLNVSSGFSTSKNPLFG